MADDIVKPEIVSSDRDWLIQKIYQFVLHARELRGIWKWFSYLLTAAALIYIIVLLFYSEQQLRDIKWDAYVPSALVALLIYLVSVLLQLCVWLRLVSFHRQVDWRDVEIYSRMILLRSLPGGVWHWVGRAAMYKAATPLSGRIVVKTNSVEWILFILTGFGVFAATNFRDLIWVFIAILFFVLSLVIAVRWQPAGRHIGVRILEGVVWIVLDVSSWWLGALILVLFVQATGITNVGLVEMARVTTLSGGISVLVALFPVVFGVRELSMVFLLQPYMPNALGLLIALLIRFEYVLGDTFWGLVGWGLSRLFQRMSRHKPDAIENTNVSAGH